jgi:hypothetical protein
MAKKIMSITLWEREHLDIGPHQLQNCCCQTAKKCRMRILYKIQSKQLFGERKKGTGT